MSYFADPYWLEQLDEQCREHNREVDGLYERIADLEAENERLRRAGYEIGYHDGAKRIADLEQLVRELRKGAIAGEMDACEQCMRDCFTDCPIYLRMKELGIEVNK